MNDISRFYYDSYPVFLISMYDPLTNQILYYQVFYLFFIIFRKYHL